MSSSRSFAIVASCVCVSGLVYAGQTVTYTYDALGRLVTTQIQSGPEAGLTESFQYDPAGNRQQYQVSGAIADTPVALSMSNTVVNQTSVGETLTVNVGASTASGTVTFSENGVFLGSTWVSSGQASVILEGFPIGVHTITATYSGDGTHAPQTTTFTIRVINITWLPSVMQLLLKH